MSIEPDFICKAKINSSIYPVEKGVYFGGNAANDKIFYCSLLGYPKDTGTVAVNGTWRATEDGIYYREVPGGNAPLKYIFIDHIKKKKTVICENIELFWGPLSGPSVLFSGEHTNNDEFFYVDKKGWINKKNINLRNMRHFFTVNNKVYFSTNGYVTEYDIITSVEKEVCKLIDNSGSDWTAHNGEVYQKIYFNGDYKLYYLGNRDYAPEEPILVIDYASRVYHFFGNSHGLITTEKSDEKGMWNINFYQKPK